MRVVSHPASLLPCHPVIPLLLLSCLVLGACRQPGELTPDTAVDRVKVQVVQDGFYRVSLAELQAAGLAATYLSSNNAHLSQANTAVPFLIDGDALVFYGQAPADPYTASRTYMVKVGQAGLGMRQTAVTGHAAAPRPEHVAVVRHLEENHVYEARARDGEESDLWFWQTLGHRQTVTLAIDLPVVANGPAVLELNLWGFTKDSRVDYDHDFDLIVNGRYQDTIRWDGAAYHTSHTELSPGSLQNGANTIVLDNAVEGAAALDVMQFTHCQ